MTFSFDAKLPFVKVTGILIGPQSLRPVIFALDTGATVSSLSEAALQSVGYDLNENLRQFRVLTGAGEIFAPEIVVQDLIALDRMRSNFALLAQTLPFDAPFDGLLGLDFLAQMRLTLDFARGEIEVV